MKFVVVAEKCTSFAPGSRAATACLPFSVLGCYLWCKDCRMKTCFGPFPESYWNQSSVPVLAFTVYQGHWAARADSPVKNRVWVFLKVSFYGLNK